jgi:hypothetical protein
MHALAAGKPMAASIFISYSHADERTLERLHKHLAVLQREGHVAAWFDRAILPGADLGEEIMAQLDTADTFVALVSPDYLASNYCYEKEFGHALERYERGELRIVPVIVEPCDWLSSPLQKFMALPKDGKPISDWTNANTAYLDVVIGLRRLVTAAPLGRGEPVAEARAASSDTRRRVRLKRDFDVIEKAEFADKTFQVMRDYFAAAAKELSEASEDLRTRFEEMSATAFTCTIVNRARRGGRDAHVTVHNKKGRGYFGDISYVWESHAADNTSNGSVRVEADDYDLFLVTDRMFGGRDADAKLSPERAAEWLWNNFVEQAGIEYE